MFDRRYVLPLALAAVVLAGIVGYAVVTNDAPDLGPTPPPNETPSTPLPDQMPPGIDNGTVSPANLAEQHATTLKQTSYTLMFSRVTADGNRTEERVAASGGRFHVTRTGTQATPSVTFASGQLTAVKAGAGDDATVRRTTRRSTDAYTKQSVVRATLEAGMFEPVTGVRDGGETLVKLRATSLSEPNKLRLLAGLDNISAIDGTMRVGPDGRVHDMNVTVDGTIDGEATGVRLRLATSDVGATSVERPEWASEAANTTVSVDARMSQNARAIYILHAGGATVPQGTTLQVVNPTGTESTVALNRPLAEGDVAYISFSQGSPNVNVNDPPSMRGEPLSSSYFLTAVEPDGTTLFETAVSSG